MALIFHLFGNNPIRTEVYTFSESSSITRMPMYRNQAQFGAHGSDRGGQLKEYV
jgi:hypothetical protein